jgi:hypothetical protein
VELINPATGQPFTAGEAQPPVGSHVPVNGGMIAGIAIYESDETFVRFIAADDEGVLAESFTVEPGQFICMLIEIARAMPNPGTTISRVGAQLERPINPADDEPVLDNSEEGI